VTTRAKLLIAAAAVLAFALAALLFSPLRVLIDDPADGDPVRGVSTVAVDDGEFAPPVIEVPAGTTVTWEFRDTDDGEPVAHNVKGDGFLSPDVQRGRYKRTFERPGSYRYRCDLHFRMRGRVDVAAARAAR
jgi:plastocyanin